MTPPDWTQGAHLAPDENRMTGRSPEEFARRYGLGLHLYRALACAQEVVEVWRDLEEALRADDTPRALRLRRTWRDATCDLGAALEAMQREPTR